VITEAIVSGQLISDHLYSVQSLSDELGVSRTPVREALIQLVRQGMVQFERNRGVRIVPITVRGIEDIFQIRIWLEVPSTVEGARRMSTADRRVLRTEYRAMRAAARAANQRELWRHDRAFHDLILRAAGNMRVVDLVGDLRELLVIRRTTTLELSTRSPQDVAAAHRPILEAIDAGDGEAAGEAMKEHLTRTCRLLLQQEGGDAQPTTE
jgi:DNA-binding GntR family transcriptional regulator